MMWQALAFDGYAFWLLLGLLLLISEFFVPGVIAVFFGIGALLVGLLTLLGLIDSLAVQLSLFGISSVLFLFLLRQRFRRWMYGAEADKSTHDLDDAGLLGARVTVIADFVDGAGVVSLNGSRWDAESELPLKAGEVAWVTGHTGIVLQVGSKASIAG